MEFLVSYLSLSISKTLTEPLERVRIIQQTQPVNFNDPDKLYGGFLDTFIRIFYERPPTSFFLIGILLVYFRGAFFNSVRSIPKNASDSVTKKRLIPLVDWILPLSRSKEGKDDLSSSHLIIVAMRRTAIGMLASMVSHVFCFPFDFERTSQESDVNYVNRSFFGYTRSAIEVYGIWHIYRAYWISVLGILPFRGGYILCRILITSLLLRLSKNNTSRKRLSNPIFWMVSQFSYLFAAFVAYPLETLRRRVMVSGAEYHKSYNGALDCFVRLYSEEGISSFFNGFFANVARDFVAQLLIDGLNFMLRKLLVGRKEKKEK